MTETAALVVIATASALEGKEQELEAALREAAGPTRAQRGCIGFELLRSDEDPATITAIERWAEDEDHDRHLDGTHVTRLVGRFEGIVSAPPSIVSLRPIG